MVVDPVLKPRIEQVPKVSDKALALFRDSLVWDNLVPWSTLNDPHIDSVLPRFHGVGVDFASLTVGWRYCDFEDTVANIERVKAGVRARQNYLCLGTSVDDVRAARDSGKLAIGLNFQDTLPFGSSLDRVQTFYDLGVRQANLAYNQKNLVGDGCAERTDAGLSRFGVALVKEMNRVGMLVDGSHSGYRTTMDAMEVCESPFIFSHSNPFAVRPHYRSVKDDQIKACAATGGVIGINGVGFWVGDNDAPTAAIFRCLEHTVNLVGADSVGLGFDYVYDLDQVIDWVRTAPLTWPPFEGEHMVKHNYAGPEQMVDLVQVMIDHGYPDQAIRGILGENWMRLCAKVWR